MRTAKSKEIFDETSEQKSRGYSFFSMRFADPEHLQLIRDAARKRKITMNAWLIYITVEAARRELGTK